MRFEKYIKAFSPGDCHAKHVGQGEHMKARTTARKSPNVLAGIHFTGSTAELSDASKHPDKQPADQQLWSSEIETAESS